MSILADRHSRLMFQGITGREGSYHARLCAEYGSNVVAGVTPGKGGQITDQGVPVFDTVEQAVVATDANMSLLFVPPPFAADAIVEAAAAGILTIVCIAEGIPVSDMVKVVHYLKDTESRLIGPNCPGLISPGEKCKAGIMPGHIHKPGRIGVVSRSGTLTYETVGQLSGMGIGQSTCVGIGGDPLSGTSFVDVLQMFEEDPDTDGVVMIGEIGGSREQDAAEYVKEHFSKPLAALIVGQSAPSGRRMGHAGAIITGRAARAEEKIKALASAGASIISTPGHIASTVQEMMSEGTANGDAHFV